MLLATSALQQSLCEAHPARASWSWLSTSSWLLSLPSSSMDSNRDASFFVTLIFTLALSFTPSPPSAKRTDRFGRGRSVACTLLLGAAAAAAAGCGNTRPLSVSSTWSFATPEQRDLLLFSSHLLDSWAKLGKQFPICVWWGIRRWYPVKWEEAHAMR